MRIGILTSFCNLIVIRFLTFSVIIFALSEQVCAIIVLMDVVGKMLNCAHQLKALVAEMIACLIEKVRQEALRAFTTHDS